MRILERGRADDDPGDSRVRQRRSGRLAAHAAPGLHPRPARDRPRDRSDDRTVQRLACARGIEIDDVDPTRARVGEADGDGDRVDVVCDLPAVVALVQPNDLARSEVDGRVKVHRRRYPRARSTKFARSLSPAVLDFSGWNWVAKTLPVSTAATTVVPYSQVATTASGSSGVGE